MRRTTRPPPRPSAVLGSTGRHAGGRVEQALGGADLTLLGLRARRRRSFAFFTNLNTSYPGQLTTKPIAIGPHCALSLNADASRPGAELRLELLSPAGYRLRGWGEAEATPLANISGVALPALWGVPPAA
eukprot:SAG11_NODE_11719_length_742_cov_1.122862_2_plen_129_part_01